MRTVAIILFDGVQSLDVTGPFEAFAHAGGYEITTASPGGESVRTPRPPHNAGSSSSAPPAMVDALRAASRFGEVTA